MSLETLALIATIAASGGSVGLFLWRVTFLMGRLASDMERRDITLLDHENRIRKQEGVAPLPQQARARA